MSDGMKSPSTTCAALTLQRRQRRHLQPRIKGLLAFILAAIAFWMQDRTWTWLCNGIGVASLHHFSLEKRCARAIEAQCTSEDESSIQILGLSPGVYSAQTKIRLRKEPDQAAEATGDSIKALEFFEVTEVSDVDESSGLTYLRIGDRGWIFDKGIAGDWVGKPIVERVNEEEQNEYLDVLHDPKALDQYQTFLNDPTLYEAYMEYMKDPDAEGKYELKMQDFLGSQSELLAKDDARKNLEWTEFKEALKDSPALDDPKTRKKWEKICEDEKSRDLMLAVQMQQRMKLQGSDHLRKLVVPKWMKVAALLLPEMKFRLEEIKKRFSVLPGGVAGWERRPRNSALRMGIQVPSSITPL